MSNNVIDKKIEELMVDEEPRENEVENQPYLPKDYLKDGYYAITEKGAKYLRPEFVGKYAESMADLLAGMKPSDFNGLMRELKSNRKKSLPFEARQTALVELLPKVMTLVHRKKAPALLIPFIRDNIAHIHVDDDWYAFYRFMEAIVGFMSAK